MPAVLSAIATRRLARVGGTSGNVDPVAGTRSKMPNGVALRALGTSGRRSPHPHKRGQHLCFQHRPFVTSVAGPLWIVEATGTGAPPNGESAEDAIAQVHDTVAESVLLQQVQLDAGVAGECGLSVTEEHRIHEELALVDQPGVERVRREGRTPDGQIARGGRLHPPDRIGVETALKPRL